MPADDGDRSAWVEAQRLERSESIDLGGLEGAEVERGTEGDARLGNALGRADVEQLNPLAVVEKARKLGRGDVRHGAVRHRFGVSSP